MMKLILIVMIFALALWLADKAGHKMLDWNARREAIAEAAAR